MAISLDNIPTTIRVPLAYVEFNNENAVSGTAANPYRLLVLGQKTSAGTHPKLSPVLVTSADQAAKLFGVGSMLHAMLAAVKKANGYVETWALAAEDNESGQKAAATVTLSGSTTKSGHALALRRRRVRIVQGCCGEELSAVATRLASAVNADATLPVTAQAAEKAVTLTCRWAGLTGNDLDLRLNVYGEDTPAGLVATCTAFTGGTANPDVTDAIAAFGDEQWHGIVMPWTDAANMTALESELDLRWGPMKQAESIAFTAFRGTLGETSTHGNARNSHLVTCMGTGRIPDAAVYLGGRQRRDRDRVSGNRSRAALADAGASRRHSPGASRPLDDGGAQRPSP